MAGIPRQPPDGARAQRQIHGRAHTDLSAPRRKPAPGYVPWRLQILPPMRDAKRDIIFTALDSAIADRTTPLCENEFVWSISF
jgi:hypothetical protein